MKKGMSVQLSELRKYIENLHLFAEDYKNNALYVDFVCEEFARNQTTVWVIEDFEDIKDEDIEEIRSKVSLDLYFLSRLFEKLLSIADDEIMSEEEKMYNLCYFIVKLYNLQLHLFHYDDLPKVIMDKQYGFEFMSDFIRICKTYLEEYYQ